MTTSTPSQILQGIGPIPKGRIGRFIAEREIGQGSVGTVYEFRDPLIGRKVAIKVLNPQLPSNQRKLFEKHFIQEARAAGRLNHPNIVTVYDADKSEDDLLYIAMEYLDGKELRDIQKSGHQFTYKQIADMVARIANALDYAHQHGVIHRDIKPANIFIVGKYTPKVLDFGIASASRQITDPNTTLGFNTLAERRLLGTPSYMSPEQTRAEILDARTDIFSLGVVLYELLCGQLPFKGDTIQDLLESIEYDSPVPPGDIRSDVPNRLAFIAGKAMAKKPADRYASAAEMANDLNRYLAKERTNQIIATLRKPGADGGMINDDEVESATVRNGASTRLSILLGVGVLVALSTIAAITVAAHRIANKKVVAPALQAEINKEQAGKIDVPVAAIPKPEHESVIATTTIAEASPQVEEHTVKNVPHQSTHAERKAAAKAAKLKAKIKSKSAVTNAAVVGTVQIAVTPWGEVFVDGKSQGVAPPLTHLSLSVGTHNIEIRNGDDHYTTTVQVSSGNAAKIAHHF